MNKRLLVFFTIYLSLLISHIQAQTTYTSKNNYLGSYADTDTWENNQPPVNGDVDDGILNIYGTVNRNGNLNIYKGAIYDTLNVNGDLNKYSTQTLKLIINSRLNVSGKMGIKGKVAVQDSAKLVVNGDLDVKWGQELLIKSGGTVEIEGSLRSMGKVNVRAGGKLIVKGQFSDWIYKSTYSGNIIINGDVSMSNVNLTTDANLVINGNKAHIITSDIDGDIYCSNDDADTFFGFFNDVKENTLEQLQIDEPELYEYVLDVIASNDILTWTGDTNTNWHEPSNWNNTKVPDNTMHVRIPVVANNNYPIISQKANARALEIVSGAQITMNNASEVTIRNLINDGDVFVENANDALVSLYVTNTSEGQVTFKNQYENMRFFYVGHPVAYPSVNSYLAINQAPLNNQFSMRYFQEGYQKVTSTPSYLNNPLHGIQLMIRYEMTTPDLIFTGYINNNDYLCTLNQGWQIIANPYPCYYNLTDQSLSEGDFVNTNGAVYMYTNDNNGHRVLVTYNLSTGTSSPDLFDGILPPNQAFFVYSENGGDFKTHKSYRADNGTSSSLKSSKTTNNTLRVQLHDENTYDETMVIFSVHGDDYLTKYDSHKFALNSVKTSLVYTEKDNEKLAINSLYPTDELLEVPLKLDIKNTGTYGLQFIGMDVNLKIKEEIIYIPNGTTYKFQSDIGMNEDFSVLFNHQDISTDIEAEDSDKILIYSANKILHIRNLKTNQYHNISAYNLSGKVIFNDQVQTSNYEKRLDAMSSGVYIVVVKNKDGVVTEKIAIK